MVITVLPYSSPHYTAISRAKHSGPPCTLPPYPVSVFMMSLLSLHLSYRHIAATPPSHDTGSGVSHSHPCILLISRSPERGNKFCSCCWRRAGAAQEPVFSVMQINNSSVAFCQEQPLEFFVVFNAIPSFPAPLAASPAFDILCVFPNHI